MAKFSDGTNEWEVAMSRAEAEKIVRRDLQGLILAGWASFPVAPPPELLERQYDVMFESCVQAILDGTMRLNSEGRLTIKSAGSRGNMPNPRDN